MALPTNRHSKGRRNRSRSHQFLTAHNLSRCPQCGSPKIPHRVCPTCGTYHGRQVVKLKADEPATTS